MLLLLTKESDLISPVSDGYCGKWSIKQIFQTHNAAISCLKRFAVFSVHGTESDMGQFHIRSDESGLSCTAEYLYEMHALTLIRQVNNRHPGCNPVHTHHNRSGCRF